MKNLIKTFLKKITYLIVSIIQKFKVGVYFLELLNINISNIILKSPEKKTNLKFYCPNRVNKFRIESFFTKEPETLDWINSFKNNSVFFDIGANIGLYSCYLYFNRPFIKKRFLNSYLKILPQSQWAMKPKRQI